jgi:hypothetical protein
MKFVIETNDQYRPTSVKVTNDKLTLWLAKGDSNQMALLQMATNELDNEGKYVQCLNIHLPEAAMLMLKAVVKNM